MRRAHFLCLACLMPVTGLLAAHSHSGKTVTAELDGTVLKLHFANDPCNDSRLAEVNEEFFSAGF